MPNAVYVQQASAGMAQPAGQVIVTHALQSINLGIGAEILYSFVIIFCSLMIYFGTKEIYELSSYKGLKYFRFAFLFFAVAYFFRLLIELSVTYSNVHGIMEVAPIVWRYAALFIFMYFSSMSIFYLICGVLWKNLKKNSKVIYVFHAIAIAIAAVTIVFNNSVFYIGLNFLLFISAGISIYLASHNPKFRQKKNKFNGLYLLLLIFLVLNIVNILVPIFFETLKLFFYLISLSLFFVILYKVLKKSGD